jgi:hypothetical protein
VRIRYTELTDGGNGRQQPAEEQTMRKQQQSLKAAVLTDRQKDAVRGFAALAAQTVQVPQANQATILGASAGFLRMAELPPDAYGRLRAAARAVVTGPDEQRAARAQRLGEIAEAIAKG